MTALRLSVMALLLLGVDEGRLAEAQPSDGSEAASVCERLDSDINDAGKLNKSGDRQAAEDLFHESLDSAMAEGCMLQAARAWYGLGAVALREGRLVTSVDLMKKAEAILYAGDFPNDRAARVRGLKKTVARNLGFVFFRLNWLDEALDAFHKTDTVYRILGANGEDWAKLHLQLARVYRSQGNLRKASAEIQSALGLDVRDAGLIASIWQENAWIAFMAGDLEAVDSSLDEAVEALEFEPAGSKANVYPDIAELRLRQGRWDEALKWIHEAGELTLKSRGLDLNLEALLHHLRARAHQGRGDLEQSKNAADRGLAMMDDLRAMWKAKGREFFALRQKLSRLRLDLAMTGEDAETAWTVVESYKARSLLADLSSQTETRDADGVSGKHHELLAAIRALDQDEGGGIRKLRERQFRSLRRDLLLADGDQAGPEEELAVMGAKAARELLDGETLGLHYAFGVEKIHVLVIDSRSLVASFTLDVDVGWLEESVSELFGTIEPHAVRNSGPGTDDLGWAIGRALLDPLSDRLDDYRRLAIVAENGLEKLPFEVLRHPRTRRLLVESHEMVYLPSFSTLSASRNRIAKDCELPSAALLAMGDPVFGSEDPYWPVDADDPRSDDESHVLDRLPFTAHEINGIVHLYPDGATLALGRDATRDRFLREAPRHRTIHVASHARTDPNEPELSKIALSCIDSEGHVLKSCDVYFVDVASLDLCGQVVVLSACETAKGPTVDGEGTLGLPWAFLHAGAASVVASLWPVADEPTAELMVSFHARLRKGHNPAEALRKAKLDLIREGRPPSAWAAFVLVGDWRFENPSSTFSESSGPIDRIN